MKNNLYQIIGVAAAIAAPISPLCVVFLFLNVLDYISRLISIKINHKKINSEENFRGILKKGGMWILIFAALGLDMMLHLSGLMEKIPINGWYVSSVTVIWLSSNEIISIIENLGELDIEIPFLGRIAAWCKKQIGEDK